MLGDRGTGQTGLIYQLPGLMNATIGRAREVAEMGDVLRRADVRLLTLSGPGGVGKTRLALEVAREQLALYEHGVCFVSLAPLTEPEQVLPAIAHALGVENAPAQPLLPRLKHYLRPRRLLLVLDNFEHVLQAAPSVADLLAATPHLNVLASSRERLRIYGEHEIQVQPLALPDLATPATEGESPAAMQLFVERAQAVQPAFRLNGENWGSVAEICIHLDGLPLAIELAAARTKLLTPAAILERLQHMLSLLTGGARDLPPRQQSLRNTLDWSYALLTADEQRYFSRLGVFLGSWSLRDATAIALPARDKQTTTPSPSDEEREEAALALLTSLVDKSLVRIVDMEGEARFMLLETICEYALDCLERQQELAGARQQHARYYTAFAEEVTGMLHGREQRGALRLLDRAAPNLWGALRWLVTSGDAEGSTCLAAALVDLVSLRGFLSEGRDWFEETLKQEGARDEQRARVLYGAGLVARLRNDLARARERLNEAARMGGARTQALALGELAQLALHQGKYEQARVHAEQGMAILQDDNDRWRPGILNNICGIAAGKQSDFKGAQAYYDKALALLRSAGDLHGQAEVLYNLGGLLWLRGKLRSAQSLFQRSLVLLQETDDRWKQVACLNSVAGLLRVQGHYSEARETFERALHLATAPGHTREQANALEGLGLLALDLGELEEAGRHLRDGLRLARESSYSPGIAQAFCALGHLADDREQPDEAVAYYEQSLDRARRMDDRVTIATALLGLGCALRRLDPARAATTLAHALRLTRELGAGPIFTQALEAQAVLYHEQGQPQLAAQLCAAVEQQREILGMPRAPARRAAYERLVEDLRTNLGPAAFDDLWHRGRNLLPERLLDLSAQPREGDKRPAYPAGLTTREVEVLRLLAHGLSDAHIARELVLSPRTINTHLRSIYAKLGVSSRSAATRFAFEQRLV